MLEKDYGFDVETELIYLQTLAQVSERFSEKREQQNIRAGLVMDMEGVLIFDNDDYLPTEEEIHTVLYQGAPDLEEITRRKRFLGIYDHIAEPHITVWTTNRAIPEKLLQLESAGVLPLMILSAATRERVAGFNSYSHLFGIPDLPYFAHPVGEYHKYAGPFKSDVMEMTFEFLRTRHGVELPLILLDDREDILQDVRERNHCYLRAMQLRNSRTRKHPLPDNIEVTSWKTIERDIMKLV